MDRRAFLRGAAGGSAVLAVVGSGRAVAGPGGGASGVKDEGVGTYTDSSVGNQISNFSINRCMISCGVGTITNGEQSGPFAMLMYATSIASYRADHQAKRIVATGRMRSITRVGGATVEDVEHDFLAIALDRGTGGATPDRFDVHFTTPFWMPGNPLCTPSTERPGWCRFGGDLIVDEQGRQMGDVAVGP